MAHNDGRGDDLEVIEFGVLPPIGDEFKYEFWTGAQILGIEGMVEIDPSDSDAEDKLISLNFFGDGCARSQQLYFSNEVNEKMFDD